MPFANNIIEPRKRGRNVYEDCEAKVDCNMCSFSNFAIIKVLKQLVSFTENAGFMFNELAKEGSKVIERMTLMQNKIDSLNTLCENLDAEKEEVGKGFGDNLKETYKQICNRTLFYSSIQTCDTRLIAKESRSSGLENLCLTYAQPVLPFYLYDELRDDSRVSLKLYSDTDLFYLAWKDSVESRILEHKAKNVVKRKKTVQQTRYRRVRQPRMTNLERAQRKKMGKELTVTAPNRAPEDLEPILEDDLFSTDDEFSPDDDSFGSEDGVSYKSDDIVITGENSSKDIAANDMINANEWQRKGDEIPQPPTNTFEYEIPQPPNSENNTNSIPPPPLILNTDKNKPANTTPPPPPLRRSSKPNTSISLHRKTIYRKDGMAGNLDLPNETLEDKTKFDYSSRKEDYDIISALDELTQLQL